MFHSDANGATQLIADHLAPTANSRSFDYDLDGLRATRPNSRAPDPWLLPSVDALDLFGYWKIGDSVLDATFGHGSI